MGIFLGEREKPEGCIAETIEGVAQSYWDEWMGSNRSIMCSDLSGYPTLRSEEDRDAFFSGGGPEKCTEKYIKVATEMTLRLLKQ